MKAIHIYITICICCYLLPITPQQVGFAPGQPAYTHITYIFFHTGIIHLITNLTSMYFLCKYGKYSYKTILTAIIIAAISSTIIKYGQNPTVGSSGVVLALSAFHTIKCINNNIKSVTQLIAAILISMSLGFFNHNINPAIHIVSYTIAFILYEIYTKIEQNRNHTAK